MAKKRNSEQAATQEFSRERLIGRLFKRLNVPFWGQLLVYAIGGLVVAAVVAYWHISSGTDKAVSKIEAVRKEFDDRIVGMESHLNSRIDELYSRLATRLIEDAKREALSGRLAEATREIQLASKMISFARQDKASVSPVFFKQIITGVDGFELSPHSPAVLRMSLHRIRSELAAYRSALEQPRQVALLRFQRAEHVIIDIPRLYWDGIDFDFTEVTGNAIELGPHLTKRLSDNVVFNNSVIRGGTVTLDGIHWQGVVFIGTHISYAGGEVALFDVQFVNCTFDVPQNKKANQVTDYVALQLKSLTINEPQNPGV